MKQWLPVIPLLMGVLLSGCGWFASKELPGASQTTDEASSRKEKHSARVSIERLPQGKTKLVSDVTIVWSIPSDPVDGFVLRYGFSREKLEHSRRVAIPELTKSEDPNHGAVYRYILKDLPSDKVIFVAVTAFLQDQESPLSDTYEVPVQDNR